MPKTVRAVISGRVQGVGYRAWTVREALKSGLTGWVRNRSDGTVEAVFSGADEVVDKILIACRMGPGMAKISKIEIYIYSEEIGNEGFIARPTE